MLDGSIRFILIVGLEDVVTDWVLLEFLDWFKLGKLNGLSILLDWRY